MAQHDSKIDFTEAENQLLVADNNAGQSRPVDQYFTFTNDPISHDGFLSLAIRLLFLRNVKTFFFFFQLFPVSV